MSKPSQPSPAQVCDLLHAIDPNLRLVTSRPLTGGVSAQVTAIEAQLPGGQVDRLVLRQYGAANLRSDPHVALHEFALLTLLQAAGLLVPRPRYADESAAIVPVPCLVIEFIDGYVVTDASQLAAPLTDFTRQLAAALAQLHAAEFTSADAPYLADVRAKAALKVETWPWTAPWLPLSTGKTPCSAIRCTTSLTRGWSFAWPSACPRLASSPGSTASLGRLST